ncbi:MAG: L-ribulose-5-phosphate 4-epimerase [Clostridia bacterium]|nr:L-ribulose-5-phosphate 4-epimerase [Clostridia bacterium]
MESLKKEVYEANMDLVRLNLVLFTWGNVSGIDRDQGLVVIKPSGVAYSDLSPIDLPVLDLETGAVVEGSYRPSSDTPTHLALYRAFPELGGITHTHSVYATSFAQAGRDLKAYGTTHADHFAGDIPCTRMMTPEEIGGEYEAETANVIIETFRERNLSPAEIAAVLVHSHGPFTWGKNAAKSVENAAVLETVAQMAFQCELLEAAVPLGGTRIQQELLEKHFFRKHGANAYYGQN